MSFRPYTAILEQSNANNSSVSAQLKNDTGSSIAMLLPVTIDSDGKLKLIDVAIQADALNACGITQAAIPNASLGAITLSGKIENITTGFTFGDTLYVSKTGTLTTDLPTEGSFGFVAGDYVIRIGVIVRNRTTPANKDLLVKMAVIGQL